MPRNNPTLTGLIGSGTIEGFAGYPQMTKGIKDNLEAFMKRCNTGSSDHFLASRQLFQQALAIASGRLVGPEYSPKIYGWRTKDKGSPGGNFRSALNLQGQTFFTLTPEFVADPHGNNRGKK